MNPPRILLASTSRYRRALLARLGRPFDVEPSRYDEEVGKAELAHLDHGALALALAHGKAAEVAARFPDAVVIGGDQIAELDGERLDKPGTSERASAQLTRLAGRTHRLLTAVVVRRGHRAEEHLHVHELSMRPLTPAQIEAYVARDAPLDSCGSYRIEATGVALFERIRGDDATAIEGLPLLWLAGALERVGVVVLGS
jgi:septum formation protein